MKIPVYFCIDIGEVAAVFTDHETFPASASDKWVCYAHFGEHSECDTEWVTQIARPATPEEYAGLLQELRRIYERDGDTLEVQTSFDPK